MFPSGAGNQSMRSWRWHRYENAPIYVGASLLSAEKGTRTLTGIPPLRPERSASACSAISARHSCRVYPQAPSLSSHSIESSLTIILRVLIYHLLAVRNRSLGSIMELNCTPFTISSTA